MELAREHRPTLVARLEDAAAQRKAHGSWQVTGAQVVIASNANQERFPFQCLLVWAGDGRYRYAGEIEDSGRRLLGDGRLYPRRASPEQDARFLNRNDDGVRPPWPGTRMPVNLVRRHRVRYRGRATASC